MCEKKLVPKLRFSGFDDEWEHNLGKDIFNIMGGGPFKSEDSCHEGVKWLKIANVGINQIKTDELSYLPLNFLDLYKQYIIKKNDVILALTRPLLDHKLKITIVNNEFDNSLLNQRVGKITVKNNNILKFIYYYLQLPYSIYYLESMISGTDPPNLSNKDLLNIPMNMPTFQEQKKISEFFSKIEIKVNLLEKKYDAYYNFKKYLMQQIFAQKLRFKSADGEPYGDWKERKLSEFLTEHKLKSTGKEEVYSVSVHKGLVNQKEHLGRDFSAPDTSKYNLVKPGDIVYTKSPTGDFPLGIIKQSRVDKNVIVSPLYGVFTPETYALGYILNDYFESNVNTHNYLHPIVQKGAKNTMNITNKTFLSKTLFVPTDVKEQQKIAECLSNVNDSIKNIEIQQNKVNEFKKGLLQQMFV